MVILGLGTNLGDRLHNLRRALDHLRTLPQVTIQQVSPVYVSDALMPDNAPESWNQPYFNLAIRIETSLSPYDLLHQLKEIERKVGRTPEKEWGPRIIDIDLLAWDDLIQYDEKLHIPHESLHERPFALWPFADVAPQWVYPLPGLHQGKTAAEMVAPWGSRFTGEAPFHTRQISQRIDMPRLVGIINLTPDSFSDGGEYNSVASALQHIEHHVTTGAEIIDLGAESTRPHATPISATEEWLRLEPVLTAALEQRNRLILSPKISIDTRHAYVAEKALALGADWINDVTGFDDPAMCSVVRDHTADVVVMHHLGIPAQQQTLPPDSCPIDAILRYAEIKLAQLQKLGITQDRIIFDIGIGFGKTAEQSLTLLQHIAAFQTLGTRLLVGHSRKSFLTLLTNHPAKERDIETVVLSLFLAQQSIDYLRVHNTEMHARAFRTLATYQTH